MALLFADSFSNYNTPTIAALGKWQSAVNSLGFLTIVGGAGRNGNSALDINVVGAASAPSYLQRAMGSSLSRIVVGFAINVLSFDPTNEEPFLQFLDAGVAQVTVLMLPNGQIRFRKGTTKGTLLSTSNAPVITATGVYFYVEFDITFNSATGALVLHSNGNNVTLSASSGLNTAPSGNNSFNTFQMGFTDNADLTTATAHYRFSDLYMVSTSGGTNTGFLGDINVVCLFPSGAGASTQFTPNGAATNWQCVNEVSEDAGATFVSDANVGDEDLYVKPALPANTGTIFGIQQCAVAQKDAASGRSLQNVNLSGATTTPGASHALATSYAWYLDIVEQDPNASAAWTPTTLNAAQIGVKVSA